MSGLGGLVIKAQRLDWSSVEGEMGSDETGMQGLAHSVQFPLQDQAQRYLFRSLVATLPLQPESVP